MYIWYRSRCYKGIEHASLQQRLTCPSSTSHSHFVVIATVERYNVPFPHPQTTSQDRPQSSSCTWSSSPSPKCDDQVRLSSTSSPRWSIQGCWTHGDLGLPSYCHQSTMVHFGAAETALARRSMPPKSVCLMEQMSASAKGSSTIFPDLLSRLRDHREDGLVHWHGHSPSVTTAPPARS